MFSTVVSVTHLVILLVEAGVTSEDSGFQRYECYRDLCLSRQQFCSDREQRCKLCRPAHCINRDLTPKECVPLCPDLLNPPTTTAEVPRSTTAPKANTNNSSSGQQSSNNQKGFYVSLGALLLSVGLVLAPLGVLIILGVCILFYVKDIRRRLPLSHEDAVERGRTLGSEEEKKALLKIGCEREDSDNTNGTVSAICLHSQSMS